MKKKYVILAMILIISMLLFTLSACDGGNYIMEMVYAPSKKPAEPIVERQLKFNKNGEFKVIQMTDFHEWMAIEGTTMMNYEIKDTLKPRLEQFIDNILNAEKPDLVVLTGDNGFCLGFVADFLSNIMGKTYARFGKIFEERKQYWTFTFGNHDSEGPKNKIDLMNAVKDYKYFVGGLTDTDNYKSLVYSTKDSAGDVDDRYGNFSIPIYDKTSAFVNYNIYLLDSGAYNYKPQDGTPYRYIQDRQVDWYANIANDLKAANGGTVVPSLMFTHIPLWELKDAVNDAYKNNSDTIGSLVGFSPSKVRSKIFAKMVEIGDVRGVFFGHNHSSSITALYTRKKAKIMVGITPQAAAAKYWDTTANMECRRIVIKENGDVITGILTDDAMFKSTNGLVNNEQMSYYDGANYEVYKNL